MCTSLFRFFFDTHTHKRTAIVLPPHWLQHHDVTPRLIGCEAAEGRSRDGGRGETEGGSERGARMKENAGTRSSVGSEGGGRLQTGDARVPVALP